MTHRCQHCNSREDSDDKIEELEAIETAIRYVAEKCRGFGEHDICISAKDVADRLFRILDGEPPKEGFFPTGPSTKCSACGTLKAFGIICKRCLKGLMDLNHAASEYDNEAMKSEAKARAKAEAEVVRLERENERLNVTCECHITELGKAEVEVAKETKRANDNWNTGIKWGKERDAARAKVTRLQEEFAEAKRKMKTWVEDHEPEAGGPQ